VSTGQKGSKSTYNCQKNIDNTTLKHNIKKCAMAWQEYHTVMKNVDTYKRQLLVLKWTFVSSAH